MSLSLLAVKAFNYPIAINATVLNYTQIKDDNWSFTIQFTSNITTWDITHTLSQFQQLDIKLRKCKELESIKLPRSIAQLPSSRFTESGKQIVEDYLWRLLRRAYVFISLPMQTFISLPIIMKPKTKLLSKQLSIIIRDDILLYSAENNNKYIDMQCILRSSYVFDAYKVSEINEYMIHNELNEGFGDEDANKECIFRIDVVQIKRVLRYQKDYKFAIETRKGVLYAFKCKNQIQFNQCLNDIKNMIKALDGCTPYLNKWEAVEANNNDYFEEKVIEKIDISDDELDFLDFNLSMNNNTHICEEKHNEYIDRVDIDIESCFDDKVSNSVSIQHTVYDTDSSTDEEDEDDNINEDYEHMIYDEILSTHNTENDVLLQSENSLTLEKQQMVKQFESEKASVISYNNGTINADKADLCMVSMDEYNLLREQMFLWQSKANRWEDMANRFERNQHKMEIKLKEKELKYKHKIKDQHNEILTLTKLYNQTQNELENKVMELAQLSSASNMAIQELVSYKNNNEKRKKNSYIDGTLWKFIGDGMNNIKFNKAPRLKYVMYVPTKRKLYYSDSQLDDADTKLINVTFISHRNQEIMMNLPSKYKNIWIKIIGQNRIVLFVAKNEEDADRWYDTIKNSLQQYNDDDY